MGLVGGEEEISFFFHRKESNKSFTNHLVVPKVNKVGEENQLDSLAREAMQQLSENNASVQYQGGEYISDIDNNLKSLTQELSVLRRQVEDFKEELSKKQRVEGASSRTGEMRVVFVPMLIPAEQYDNFLLGGAFSPNL